MSDISEEFKSIQVSFEKNLNSMGFKVFSATSLDIDSFLNQRDNPDEIIATACCAVSSDAVLNTRPDLLFNFLKSFDVNVTFMVISESLKARNQNVDLLKSYVDDFPGISVMIYDASPISVVFGSQHYGMLKLIRSYFIQSGAPKERFSFA